jgi:hypothetical protein
MRTTGDGLRFVLFASDPREALDDPAEIAGVHFHSDTIAGRNLANAACTILSSVNMPQTVPTAIPPDNAADPA